MILGPVVKAHHRRRAHAVADEQGLKNHAHIHQHPIGGNSILPGIVQQLDVVEHIHQGHGDVAQQFGRAVQADLGQGPSVQIKPSQPQQTGVWPGKVYQGNDAAHALADGRGSRRSLQSPGQHGNKQPVQHHVGHTGGNGDVQPQLGLSGGGEQALKLILQNIYGNRQQNHLAVADAVLQQDPLRPHGPGQGPQEQNAPGAQNHAADQRNVDHHGEQPVGLLLPSFPHGFGNQRTAAGAQQKSQAPQHHQKRHNEVDGGKRGLAHIIRHKKSVHHPVN